MFHKSLLALIDVITLARARGDMSICTADLIRSMDGKLFAGVGLSAHESPNAQFGRVLSRVSAALGLSIVRRRKSVRDDAGRRTCTAVWAL